MIQFYKLPRLVRFIEMESRMWLPGLDGGPSIK